MQTDYYTDNGIYLNNKILIFQKLICIFSFKLKKKIIITKKIQFYPYFSWSVETFFKNCSPSFVVLYDRSHVAQTKQS